MKDNRIYNALNIIVDLLSDLHEVHFDYENGKCICLECGKEWYSDEHRRSECKSYKLNRLYEIALSFDEG